MKSYLPINTLFDAEHYTQVSQLASVLKNRNFGTKHANTVRDIIQKLRRGLPTIWAENPCLSELFPYPEVNRHFVYEQPYGRHKQFCSLRIALYEGGFFYGETWFPIYTNFEHIRLRHVSKSSGEFTVNQMNELLTTGLLFSRILSRIPALQKKLDSERGLPIVLPDDQGLYLCHAERIPPSQKDKAIDIFRWRDNHGRYFNDDQPPFWDPDVRIFAHTFLPKHELDFHQHEIFKKFREFAQNPMFIKASAAFWLSTVVPNLAPGHDSNFKRVLQGERAPNEGLKGMPALEQKLADFLAEHDWRAIFSKYPVEQAPIIDEKARQLHPMACCADKPSAITVPIPGATTILPGLHTQPALPPSIRAAQALLSLKPR